MSESTYNQKAELSDLFGAIENIIDSDSFQSKSFFILKLDEEDSLQDFFSVHASKPIFLGQELQILTIEEAFNSIDGPMNYFLFKDFKNGNNGLSITISLHLNGQEKFDFSGSYKGSKWVVEYRLWPG